MRRNILIIISFLTLLVASGCTNLDEKWYSEVTPDTYFTSKETVYSFWYALSRTGVGFTDSTVPFFRNVQQTRCVSHKRNTLQ